MQTEIFLMVPGIVYEQAKELRNQQKYREALALVQNNLIEFRFPTDHPVSRLQKARLEYTKVDPINNSSKSWSMM